MTDKVLACTVCGEKLKSENEFRVEKCWVCRHLEISAAKEQHLPTPIEA